MLTDEMQNSPSGMIPASRIRSERERAALSQQVLATRAGISLSTLSRIEQGDDVKYSTLEAIANVLGVSVADLVSAPAA